MNLERDARNPASAGNDPLSQVSKQTLSVLNRLLKDQFVFRPEMPVSCRSLYGDDLWDLSDPSNLRLAKYCPAVLTIDWIQLCDKFKLTEAIISDIKRYAFIRYTYSREVCGSITNSHPATLTSEVKKLVSFLSHVRREIVGADGLSLIENISDIQFEDLGNAAITYKSSLSHGLRTALKCLAAPMLGKYLNGGLKWTSEDLKTMDWSTTQRGHHEPLPDGVFNLLSDSASEDITHFLWALGFETENDTALENAENKFLSVLPNLREIFAEYVQRRESLRDWRMKQNTRFPDYANWRRSEKNSVPKLEEIIDRVQMAAETIVALYTGARMSELSLFQVGCLHREGDFWFLRGTVIKHRGIDEPTSTDKWPAIPIVRDAVKAMQELNRLNNGTWLFHGFAYCSRSTPMGSGELSSRLTSYLRLADFEDRWESIQIHAQQFRESLAFELRKADLGLPFITWQLKHASYAFSHALNDTTLGYGKIGVNASRRAVERANLEAVREIYHPDAQFAGGGAEQHKRRVTDYFRGRTERGENVDELLGEMAKHGGVPLTDVGTGYCMGQLKVVVDGVKTDPLCIGSLRCNPNRCANGIIPKHKAPLWKAMGKANRARAGDPEFAHARTELEEAADECDAVVAFLDRKNNQTGSNAN